MFSKRFMVAIQISMMISHSESYATGHFDQNLVDAISTGWNAYEQVFSFDSLDDVFALATGSTNPSNMMLFTREEKINNNNNNSNQDFAMTASGLRYQITKEGSGRIPVSGNTVKAHYTGWLGNFDSSKVVCSSRDGGSSSMPLCFEIGNNCNNIIQGLEECISDMAVGEQRRIIIPASMGYGDRGDGNMISGDSTLYYDVELLEVATTNTKSRRLFSRMPLLRRAFT